MLALTIQRVVRRRAVNDDTRPYNNVTQVNPWAFMWSCRLRRSVVQMTMTQWLHYKDARCSSYHLILTAVLMPRSMYTCLWLYCHSTRSSSIVTLARPPTRSCLKITNRSLRYAALCPCNQLPTKHREYRQIGLLYSLLHFHLLTRMAVYHLYQRRHQSLASSGGGVKRFGGTWQASNPRRRRRRRGWGMERGYPIHIHFRYISSPVCLSVVCNVRAPYSVGWNVRHVFMPFGGVSIRWQGGEILRGSSQGKPSVRGVKYRMVTELVGKMRLFSG